MIEISETMARYLFNSDEEVYILYPDGTESLVEDITDIQDIDDDCIFGREE